MILRNLGCGIGKGILAGLAGTAAITASQMVEMKLRGRPPSKTPAQVAEKLLGIQPKKEKAESLLSQLVHFAYGTSWGMARSLLSATGMRGAPATVLHWGAVQQASMVLLPTLGVAPPAKEWGRKQVGMEMFHHLVYAAAAGWVHTLSGNKAPSWCSIRAMRKSGAGIACLIGILGAGLFMLQSGPLPEPAGEG